MPSTTDDLQTQLAYRLGETAAPSDSTTKAIRLEWLNQAYMDIARRKNWWWLQSSDTSNTNTGSTTGYAEPTDLREFIELKVGDVYYDQIPYIQNRDNYNGIVSIARSTLTRDYYRFGGRYYFQIADDAGGDTHYIKYYKRVVKIVSGGTFLMPDEYLEALVAYAEGRYWLSITQQNKAIVSMQQFEEVVQQMAIEQGRRGVGHKKYNEIRDPEDAYY